MHGPGEPAPHASRDASFVALDFETATCDSDSACSLGVVAVEGSRIARRRRWLIRPPYRQFEFTYIHGISWRMVRHQPSFGEVWPEVVREVEGARFLAAHNASFDRDVLEASCRSACVRPPALPYVCTVQLARRTWGIFPTKLPDVCGVLGISLEHHEALSDAEACARIVIAAGPRRVRAALRGTRRERCS